MAKIYYTEQALREIRALPKAIRGRIEDILVALEKWPNVSGAKPLRGRLKGHFRKRTGDFRVIFKIETEDVIVVKAGNRKDVYEDEP
ncbi:MAG: type II toxin-antitoxin system RelE family toxin [Phycisphaerales bacterium]